MILHAIPHFSFILVSIILTVVTYLALTFGWLTENSGIISDLLLFLPPIASLVGILLGLRFNRSRLVLASILVGSLSFVLCSMFMPHGPWYGRIALMGKIFLPLLMGILVWKRERGLITSAGIPWTTVTCAIIIAPCLLWLLEPAFFTQFFNPLQDFSHQISSIQLLIYWGLCLVSCLVCFILHKEVIDISFVFILMLSGLALVNLEFEPEAINFKSNVYFGLALLIANIGLMEISYSLAFNDQLTGLPGRRALDEAMAKLSGKYSIAMSDIDHFKKFNDTYGHDTGDKVLQVVAKHLESISGGKVYRYGGEEFAIIFPGYNVDEAVPRLDKVRQKLADSPITVTKTSKSKKNPGTKEIEVKITISMGVAGPSDAIENPAQIIKNADKALYMAKEGGRNQVAAYGQQLIAKKSTVKKKKSSTPSSSSSTKAKTKKTAET